MPIIQIPKNPLLITAPQYNYLLALMENLEIYDNRIAYFKEYIGKIDLDSFTIGEADKMICLLKKWKQDKEDKDKDA